VQSVNALLQREMHVAGLELRRMAAAGGDGAVSEPDLIAKADSVRWVVMPLVMLLVGLRCSQVLVSSLS
jgi:hypothetical protein